MDESDEKCKKTVVACWGDSLTYGQGARAPMTNSYPSVLKKLTGMDVKNMGVGGETSITIAARQGGLLLKTDSDFEIPESGGEVYFEFSAYDYDGSYAGIVTPRCISYGGWEELKVNGIRGSMKISIADTNPRTLNWAKFVCPPQEKSVLIRKGTLIYPLSLETASRADINIFFTGANGGWNLSNQVPNDEYADDLVKLTDKMINHSKDKSKYIVIGLIGGDANLYKRTDSAMREAFGDRFLNAKRLLASEKALEFAKIIPTPKDSEDIKQGRIPPSLKIEDGHLNDSGYLLLAHSVYEKMVQLGYCE